MTKNYKDIFIVKRIYEDNIKKTLGWVYEWKEMLDNSTKMNYGMKQKINLQSSLIGVI